MTMVECGRATLCGLLSEKGFWVESCCRIWQKIVCGRD